MGAFLKEVRAEARSPVPWVAWVTISMVVAISGPFGTYSAMDLTERLLFWTPAIAVAGIAATLIRALVYGVFGLHGTLNGSLLATALISLAVAPVLYGLIVLVLPPVLNNMVNPVEIVLLIAAISLGICALRVSSTPIATVEPEAEPKDQPRLLRRIDTALQGEIWAITVRDHYVDVQTSRGKTSLLMRLSDAVDEVDGVSGAQVHRSHWVGWAGVGSVCREGGKVNLHLKNGYQIPVSRNHRDKVDARFPPLSDLKSDAA